MNRDRFVFSVGHASALHYTLLHMTGNGLGGPYEVSMEAIKQFRQAGNSTPGHPESRMTRGGEVTTGPLGQGFANGVSMAIEEAHLSARFNREGFPLFDHYTYVLAGAGCLMEGITSEAASLAGHLQLYKLIVFYDDNKTSIDGHTDLAFTGDIAAVFAAKKWNVLHVPGEDANDAAVFENIVQEAKSQREKPTLIIMRNTIGCGAGVGIEGTSKPHRGSSANIEEIREKWFSPGGLRQSSDPVDLQVAGLVQKELDNLMSWGMSETTGERHVLPKFHVPKKVIDKFRSFGTVGDALAEEWDETVEAYIAAFRDKEPELVKDLCGYMQVKLLTDDWQSAPEHDSLCEQQRNGSGLPALFKNINMGLEPNAKRRKCWDGERKHKGAAEVLKRIFEYSPYVF